MAEVDGEKCQQTAGLSDHANGSTNHSAPLVSIPHGKTCRLAVISTGARLFTGSANHALSEVLIEGATITLPAGESAHAL